jgi:hypothetical protein
MIKSRKLEKNYWKNWIVKKKLLKYLKNQLVRFYKSEIKKPNQTEKKTEPNRKKLIQTEKNQANRLGFDFCSKITFVSVFFFKSVCLFFLDKKQTKPKIIISSLDF